MKWSIILAVFFLSGCYRDSATLNSTEIDNETAAQVEKSTTKSKVTQPHTTASSSFQPRKFSEGETLYINYCADCHGWEGRGNGQAEKYLDTQPPILLQQDLLDEKSENDFVNWILSGKEMQVQLNKKAAPQTDSEINNLLTYIKKMPSVDWAQFQAGQKVYDQLCMNCHGMYGSGDGNLSSKMPDSLPDLSNPIYQIQHSDEELIQIILKGKEAMPGTENVLNPKEIESVVSFIRHLSPGYKSYDRFCLSCHGQDGSPVQLVILDTEDEDIPFQNINLPTLNAAYLNAHTDEQLIPKIQHMLKSERVTMPHFADYIEEKKVRKIFRYLSSLIAEYP